MHNRMNEELSRRSMLQGTLGLGLAAQFHSPSVIPSAESGRPLVLIQLAGGNDGLSMIVPHGDDAYARARPRLGLLSSDVLDVDGYRGFSPSLPNLHRRFMDGGLGLVEGVGYPEPNRSHFESFEIWHAADLRGRTGADGWIGRLMQARFGKDVNANRVVHMGGKPPFSLYSKNHPAAAFSSPAGYRWVKGEPGPRALDEPKKKDNEALGFLRKSMHAARESSLALRAAVGRYKTPVDYPDDAFAAGLRNSAALLEADLGARVLSVELGGFDTHNNQAGRHRTLMERLDGGLAAFLMDLERFETGRRALVLVFSEFGRRVAENASGGTDHGCAAPMLVAGADVKPGLYGEHPSLSELDNGDLIFTTDFRRVYASAIESCFGVPSKIVLGEAFKPLPLFG